MLTRSKKQTLIAVAILLILATALTILYGLLPIIIKHRLNEDLLKNMGDYSGHVDDVDLNLFRGAYLIKDVLIVRKTGNPDLPFVYVEKIYFSLSWQALFHGAIQASTKLVNPTVNFLDAKREEKKQTGLGTDWIAVFDRILPTTLSSIEIENGKVYFRNFYTNPKVNLNARNIDVVITNLTNLQDLHGKRVATAIASATIFDSSPVNIKAEFDPFKFEDFLFAADIQNIQLVELNDFAKAYGNIDFEDGKGQVFMELRADDGKVKGYLKPLFKEVNIVSIKQDIEQQKDNPLQLIWEGVWGLVKTILTNIETEKVATEIKIEGNMKEVKFSSWQSFFGLLRNAFVEALRSQFNYITPLTESNENKKNENDNPRKSPKNKFDGKTKKVDRTRG